MRHRNKINRLGRPAGHRKALLMNLAKSLIMHKRIVTTLAKGKVLRSFIEPILTRAKQDTTHSRRIVFSHFQDKEPVKELFNHIAEKIQQRFGGYTRIIKLANRAGDNAAMCMIELVDYNDIYTKEVKPVKTVRRRRRKGSTDVVQESAVVAQEVVAEAAKE
ncbi:MAG: 50S ribosomal protein L17 [Candidatus Cardinium sp.]|uniref:50S ribosomal protein L17 n=1 Tax=Candidatus Cardinium sp. TP TaxID=2961955 RepID=UPI0021B00A39|nr:50S ribosomal protein L17 [Candidatus Cardinium sp. TP]MCT4697081.1 50S ribosomal protein L17 [Candidatus Cardinium sp. TP]MDN5246625.1 50S ribosomal protein L17 [Candidatus Cardinium sp.]